MSDSNEVPEPQVSVTVIATVGGRIFTRSATGATGLEGDPFGLAVGMARATTTDLINALNDAGYDAEVAAKAERAVASAVAWADQPVEVIQ